MPRDGTATRIRLLDAAERLVTDNGFAATSVDQVIAEAGSSKGAFFHHFSSKTDLGEQLVERYAAHDVQTLYDGLAAVAHLEDPKVRLVEFVRHFEGRGDEIMSAQSNCLYVSVLTERQLAGPDATGAILGAVVTWRDEIVTLLRDALGDTDHDLDALADHVFVTFEGAFILCRTTGDPDHMRRQLAALRVLVEALVH
ncbi:TetR/AcrR family transcriptional repressor of nem operon [Nocardioides sp. BE266]|uniref:TetR/AcrR family transcriptional regulator n=1 Tax=Nocardioides sp. BE266 TaxID=2817725 RepID=UPI0028672874|nr:TetR/AcrR family transcriptional regulator [Nocardioides sp. BE266]MDR7253117.1 TetR/AcrR family transcriptional repressor of nem operon [Nocardioides sp. BE266]